MSFSDIELLAIVMIMGNSYQNIESLTGVRVGDSTITRAIDKPLFLCEHHIKPKLQTEWGHCPNLQTETCRGCIPPLKYS